MNISKYDGDNRMPFSVRLDNIHMYIVLFVKVNIGYLKFIENVYTSLQGEIVVVREESFSLKI